MTLKDGSAFNIQFHKGKPLFIDTLSFTKRIEGVPWLPYRQFCQHFLAPLAIMRYRDPGLSRLSRLNLDGVPLGLTSRLLPRKTLLIPGLLAHLHFHAWFQSFFESRHHIAQTTKAGFGKSAHQGLIESLENAVQKLNWVFPGRGWGTYYESGYHGAEYLAHKEKIVNDFLAIAGPKVVWDLGSNIGRFSTIAASRGAQVIAFDNDMACIDWLYLTCRGKKIDNILPLVVDIMNPTPALGWSLEERYSLFERKNADLIMALALIHHLAIANNIPLPHISASFSKFGRWLIIEFVPKEDLQTAEMLKLREDIFQSYDRGAFEVAFNDYFEIIKSEAIQGSGRLLYLMKGKRP
jgi:hypothetical protein